MSNSCKCTTLWCLLFNNLEKKRSVQFRKCRSDEMTAGSELRVVIAFIDSLKFSRTDIIREISVYVIGCL